MQKTILAITAVFGLAACTTSSQPGPTGVITPAVQVQPGRQFDLAMGQSAQIQGTSITIRFSSVGEDSRCPSDVQCVWAGNAAIKVTFSADNGPTTDAALNTALDPKAAPYRGFSVRLVAVRPATKSGTRIPHADYVATFEVSRLETP